VRAYAQCHCRLKQLVLALVLRRLSVVCLTLLLTRAPGDARANDDDADDDDDGDTGAINFGGVLRGAGSIVERADHEHAESEDTTVVISSVDVANALSPPPTDLGATNKRRRRPPTTAEDDVGDGRGGGGSGGRPIVEILKTRKRKGCEREFLCRRGGSDSSSSRMRSDESWENKAGLQVRVPREGGGGACV
jgi:hypothetical protein